MRSGSRVNGWTRSSIVDMHVNDLSAGARLSLEKRSLTPSMTAGLHRTACTSSIRAAVESFNTLKTSVSSSGNATTLKDMGQLLAVQIEKSLILREASVVHHSGCACEIWRKCRQV